MALDEAILTESAADEVVLRVYRWSGPACTFGYSLRIEDARRACAERGLSVEPVRRTTGGGIVFHDGDITFSLVFPWDKTLAPETVYKNIHRGIHQALKTNGISNSLWSPNEKMTGTATACFSRPERMDIVTDNGKKCLGGALRKKGAKGLYQGSMRPEELHASREDLEKAILNGAAKEFGVMPRTDISDAWLAAGKILEEKYISSDWNTRR